MGPWGLGSAWLPARRTSHRSGGLGVRGDLWTESCPSAGILGLVGHTGGLGLERKENYGNQDEGHDHDRDDGSDGDDVSGSDCDADVGGDFDEEGMGRRTRWRRKTGSCSAGANDSAAQADGLSAVDTPTKGDAWHSDPTYSRGYEHGCDDVEGVLIYQLDRDDENHRHIPLSC